MKTIRLASWNVNGIRAIVKKDFIENMQSFAPDILCLQETKATVEETKKALTAFDTYSIYVNTSKVRKGYSGTAILTKTEPLQVSYDIGVEEHDQEGRVVTIEFLHFFLIVVYTPNAGEGLKRLDYRERWDASFLQYIQWLDKRKPVVLCGDFNVAHQPIDIARAKENYNKSAGYTQREIDGFQRILDSGFVDTFRQHHPDKQMYSYWHYFSNSRAKNIGWRIDYFVVSQRIADKVVAADIHSTYHGSDHCPISVQMPLEFSI